MLIPSKPQMTWNNAVSDKPKHKNSQITGFSQITIWGLQTTSGYCLAFFPLYVICLCPFPQGSLCIFAFHFPFICMFFFMAGVTKWNNWYLGGGGEGGGGAADMPAVTALGYFHVCWKFMEIGWAARNMDFSFSQNILHKSVNRHCLIGDHWHLIVGCLAQVNHFLFSF